MLSASADEHGNRRAVQSKTMEGLNQANNVYSYIEQNLTEKECFNSIRGGLLDKVKHSYVVSKDSMVYILTRNKIYSKKLTDLL